MASRGQVSRRGTAALCCLALSLAAGCSGGSGDDDVVLHGVTPSAISARGGEAVVLSGRGFTPGSRVLMGDRAASVIAVTPGEIEVRSPTLPAGLHDVEVILPGGASARLEGALATRPLDLAFVEAPDHYVPDLGDVLVTAAAAGDVDGDGAVDVILTTDDGGAVLLHNSATGQLRRVEPDPEDGGPGLPPWDHATRSLVLADLDGDGHLDLFACNASGEPDRLLVNDGQGRFSHAPDEALAPRRGSCLVATAADVDGDGLPDLAVIGAPDAGSPERRLRIYRNQSSPGALRLVPDEEVEPSTDASGLEIGRVYLSDGAMDARLTISSQDPAEGASSARLDYDFGGAEGYLVASLDLPGVRRVPDRVRLSIRGDGSGHHLRLRLLDAGEERHRAELGPADFTGWRTIEASDIPGWDSFLGDGNGTVDPPLGVLSLEVLREPGGPESGSLGLDDIVLEHDPSGPLLVEDFERFAPRHRWTDRISSISSADLDGSGADDLVITSDGAGGGDPLHVLLSGCAPWACQEPGALGLTALDPDDVSCPSEPVAHAAPVMADADGLADLMLVTEGQDRLLLGDGTGHLFDATRSGMPVDRVPGRHAAVGDLDLDGRDDVVIANHGAADRLYLGRGGGVFHDGSARLGLEARQSRLVLLMDVDGDGDLDVLVMSDDPPVLRLLVSVEEGGTP